MPSSPPGDVMNHSYTYPSTYLESTENRKPLFTLSYLGDRNKPMKKLDGELNSTVSHLTADVQSNEADSTAAPPISPGLTGRTLGPCAECGLRINNIADACHAMGYLYHNSCFVCCYCQRTLCGKIFYKDQDKIYCEEDYLYCGFQQTAEKCYVCGHLIYDTILQALGNSYHPGCFTCCVCTKCLDGVPFAVDARNMIYCLPDYHMAYSPYCGVCGMVILPEKGSNEIIRVVALDKEFHLDCYRCTDCKKTLVDMNEKRCYPMTEPDPNAPEKNVQRLLCLTCHLNRIGAVPATVTGSFSANPKTTSSMGSHIRFYPSQKYQGVYKKPSI